MNVNIPNILTFSRIVAAPVVSVLMFMPPPLGNWVPFAVYAFACVTDFFDGYLARAWHQQSALGRFMDPIADKLLIAAVLLMLVATDRITEMTILPAAVILFREILVSGLREFLAEVQVRVPVTVLAKWKTFIQMLALGFLLVGSAGPDFGPVTTEEIGIVGIWLAAVLTVGTGYDYLKAGLRHITETDSQ
ncbi:MAG: CDP-diacylglycerol--glycerol-3-phosphate 3-phosphatidyltransferase [Rhodospirillaceae bacterium]|jgi:cardiolipin synthase (CMP-forming)|nr:CDP-diacylglycerol--glycerol-3-phosphate 3-phosphatidyltransferase [Rhodospirillaceae bacterium]MBT4220556.1 CDP-diacylglycerol--glycerol-3-phosphate 3-phosphatidyltransferase [Rhodospirillaceae bacterium]MBT4463242.1 CDP-diacylglycerol--glycerol-3-phosphate 3-phosphatidyltransferase [Rhodospirillaceae bacterium]MBT5014719.1 CDP-diacylglycerol--glycerol-3-phosphate 3-phosphatidyltransferase [Rhodospirillaceae bacterium]MBT5309739.1 CDP-diacylglycerol--glycerol-3-phosphate 3-phosphatidyltrans